MLLTATLSILQASPASMQEIEPLLRQIAWSQMIMAGGVILVTLVALAMAVTNFLLYRAVRRLLSSVDEQVRALLPRAEPLIQTANRIAGDAEALSGKVRDRASDIARTVDEVNQKVRDLVEVTETRVRDLGAVLEVVQEETESILLDAAATARGVHATARALQSPPDRGALEPGDRER